jgi:TolB protein
VTTRSTILASLVVGTVGAAIVATSALATAPGKNGQIAFRRYLDPMTTAVFVINADGSGERQLTHPDTGVDDNQPDWSPDGAKLAFERCDIGCEVWTMNADGSGQTRLGPNCHRAQPLKCEERDAPAWAPDGKSIAFGRGWGRFGHDAIQFSEIFVMDRRGGSTRQLTHITTSKPYSADVDQAMWSPDGKRLVFQVRTSTVGRPANSVALFVINADGTGMKRLTPWKLNGGEHPDWSPDGKRILFRTIPKGDDELPGGNIYTIHPNGTGLKQLTRYGPTTELNNYSFSPDGKWITFAKSGVGKETDVYVMQSNGTGIRPITRTSVWEGGPDWGPAL